MRHLLLAAAGVVGLLVAGCSEGQAEVGPDGSRSFQVGDFKSLAVAGAFDVRVATGKAVSVSAAGPQKLLEIMDVSVEDGTLRVRSKPNSGTNINWGRRGVTVTVTVPLLEKAALAGSGDIEIDRVTGERFEGGVAGSGDLRLGDVAVRELKLDVAGSGDAGARGRAERLLVQLAGSGDVDVSGLTATTATIGLAGSGDVRARVTGEATANVAGSGDIVITGGARCTTSKRGSGEVTCS